MIHITVADEPTDVNSINITFESKGINSDENVQPFDKRDFNQLKNMDGVSNVGDDDGIMGF
ncbi:hypothetical protein [Clostridium niameyense]|uniref:hypothetical protein n=1 Tax=Clostridium niameyense TaxID=1622073 RepID=UPI00067F51AF|nr:hypothetical protein [Clostridium niameyense]